MAEFTAVVASWWFSPVNSGFFHSERPQNANIQYLQERLHKFCEFSVYSNHSQINEPWYLSHKRTAKAQASLHIRAVLARDFAVGSHNVGI